MARARVELKAIENPIARQATFGKRRRGLLKKAQELSVMCDSDVAFISFSDKDNLVHFPTHHSRMEEILERYETDSLVDQKLSVDDSESQENSSREYLKLSSEVRVLQREMSQLIGEDIDSLKLKELQGLEQQLDIALKRIRVKKNQKMNQALSELRKKEKTFKGKTKTLAEKVKCEAATLTECTEEQNHGEFSSSSSSLPPPNS